MKHIKEYQVFEKEDAQGKASEELKKKYPKLSSNLKSQFKYFFSRGLSGYFDIKENDEEQDFDNKKRLVFSFGESEKLIKDKLYERDIVLEFEKKVVYEN